MAEYIIIAFIAAALAAIAVFMWRRDRKLPQTRGRRLEARRSIADAVSGDGKRRELAISSEDYNNPPAAYVE